MVSFVLADEGERGFLFYVKEFESVWKLKRK